MKRDNRWYRRAGRGALPRRARTAGFTLIELLAVLAVLAVAMGLGIPAIQNLIVRSKTEGYARQVSTLMQRTRLEAIRKNRPGAVFMAPGDRELVAFIDADRDLAFDPDSGNPPDTRDYVVARLPLPGQVEFKDGAGSTGTASVVGTTTVEVDSAARPAAVFQPNGSILEAMPDGDPQVAFAFRIGDLRDNFLEVRIAPPATAKIEVRKFVDASSGKPDAGTYVAAPNPSDPDYADKVWEWN